MLGNDSFLRIVLGWICAGHVMTGVLLLSGRRGVRAAARLYGARFEPADQLVTIIRPTGAFVLGLGFLQALAVREPRRYIGVVDATLLVFVVRQIQRFLFRRDVYAAFRVTPARHWAMTAYFAALAALLLVARLKLAPAAK
jgi:hypothetical protein